MKERGTTVKRTLLPALWCAVLLLMGGCSGCSDGDRVEVDDKPQERIYPRITNHKLRLEIISRQAVFSSIDSVPVMRFKLFNSGMNRVVIREWRLREAENMRVLYAECPVEGSAAKLPAQAWKVSPGSDIRTECPRYPLTLEPRNGIMADIPLGFINEKIKPGRYAVKCELTLSSLPLSSDIREITVR